MSEFPSKPYIATMKSEDKLSIKEEISDEINISEQTNNIKKFYSTKMSECPSKEYISTIKSEDELSIKEEISDEIIISEETKNIKVLESNDEVPHGIYFLEDKEGSYKIVNDTPKYSKTISEGCSFKTADKRTLTKHILKHSGDLPFRCEECSFKTAYKQGLKRHILLHSGDKPFCCEDCSFKTTTKHYLKRHNIVKHSGGKPFSCEECSFKTASKYHFKLHSLKHSVDKPFSCEECSFKTAHKQSLKRHILLHYCGYKKMTYRQNPTDNHLANVSPGPGKTTTLPAGKRATQCNQIKFAWSQEDKKIITECHSYASYEKWEGAHVDRMIERLRSRIGNEKADKTRVQKIRSVLSQVDKYLNPQEINEATQAGRRAAENDYNALSEDHKNEIMRRKWSNKEKWILVWTYEYARQENNTIKTRKMTEDWRRLHGQMNNNKANLETKIFSQIRSRTLTMGYMKGKQIQSIKSQIKSVRENRIQPNLNVVLEKYPKEEDNEEEQQQGDIEVEQQRRENEVEQSQRDSEVEQLLRANELEQQQESEEVSQREVAEMDYQRQRQQNIRSER